MANRPRKITALPKITNISNTDLFVVEQVTSNNVSVTSAIAGSNLINYLVNALRENITEMILDTLDITPEGYLKHITVGTDLAPSGKTYVKENLVSNVRSTAFDPIAGRDFYVIISGSGSASLKLVYSFDGINWAPQVTGVDSGSIITLDSFSYTGTQIMIPGQVSKAGMLVSIMPGSVSGTVTVEFGQ